MCTLSPLFVCLKEALMDTAGQCTCSGRLVDDRKLQKFVREQTCLPLIF